MNTTFAGSQTYEGEYLLKVLKPGKLYRIYTGNSFDKYIRVTFLTEDFVDNILFGKRSYQPMPDIKLQNLNTELYSYKELVAMYLETKIKNLKPNLDLSTTTEYFLKFLWGKQTFYISNFSIRKEMLDLNPIT